MNDTLKMAFVVSVIIMGLTACSNLNILGSMTATTVTTEKSIDGGGAINTDLLAEQDLEQETDGELKLPIVP